MLEQANFERRKQVLKRKMKEVETNNYLVTEECELARNMKRTALEKDDVHFFISG